MNAKQGKVFTNPTNPRFALENKLRISRGNLMLVILFTVINCALLIGGSTAYFLFSAYIPYALVVIGMLLSGRMPPEYYEEGEPVALIPGSGFYVFIAVAAVILVCYLVCWILSKKHAFAAYLAALILFGIDSLLLVLDTVFGSSIDLSVLINVAFHVWVIYYLIVGLSATVQLKKLPLESEVPRFEGNPGAGVNPGFVADTPNALVGESSVEAESSPEQTTAGVAAEPVNRHETSGENSSDGDSDSSAEG